MKNSKQQEQFETYLQKKLTKLPEDERFASTTLTAQEALRRAMSSGEEDVQQPARSSKFGLRIKVSFAIAAAVVVGFFFTSLSRNTPQQRDVFALAAKKYEKRKGILILVGSTTVDGKRWLPDQKMWVRDRGHNDFQRWFTTDGLYSRSLTKLTIGANTSKAEHVENVLAPEGQCSAGFGRRYVQVFSNSRFLQGKTNSSDAYSDGLASRSCPFGLGLQTRVRQKSISPEQKKEFFYKDVERDTFQAVVDPSTFLRKVRAGEFGRYEVKKTVERGVKVYVIRAWEKAVWLDAPAGKSRLLDDLKERTLVLDRYTLDIRSYGERSFYNPDGKHKQWRVEKTVFSKPPRLVPENNKNAHLLRMTFAPSRVDLNPFDKRDQEISEKLYKKYH